DTFHLLVLGPNLTITGTPDDDVLEGGPGADILSGLAGNDILRGLGGDDSLDGGPGNDTLVGGDGSDTYIFGIDSGIDTIDNGDGAPLTSQDVVSVSGTTTRFNVVFELVGQDPSMRIAGTLDRLVFSGMATVADGDQIDRIQFTNGQKIDTHLGT